MTALPEENTELLRGHFRDRLPEHMRAALAGYERFTADEPPADAKGFAAWHAAAKAALAHVDVLLKLMRWAEGRGDAEATAEDGLDALLSQARCALDQLGDEGDDT